jgi:hypothetical protein
MIYCKIRSWYTKPAGCNVKYYLAGVQLPVIWINPEMKNGK